MLHGKIHLSRVFPIIGVGSFLHHRGSLSSLFAERRVVEQISSKLFQFHKDILRPRQSLEVFKRLEVL